MVRYKNIIAQFDQKKILVIGDVILDQYIQGHVSRISPEAPVPVVLEEKSFYTPGGAANVAHNLVALDAQVTLVGCVGRDQEGKTLKALLKDKGINIEGIIPQSQSPTVLKTRVIAQHQQVVRIDRENTQQMLNGRTLKKILNFIENHIDDYDAIIISDYGKGLITPNLVRQVCQWSKDKKKILCIDPKVEHFTYYRHATAITPNLKEAENAIRNIKMTAHSQQNLEVSSDKLLTDDDIDLAGQQLLHYLDLESLLITLSEKGMRLFERGKEPFSIKTQAQDVFDVTGAGDAVISVFTVAMACGANKRQSADIANHAAGIVVGKMGAATATRDELLNVL